MNFFQHVAIAVAVNHGLGDELGLFGPLVSALMKRQEVAVSIFTFHPNLYNQVGIAAYDWRSLPRTEFIPPLSDLGFCLTTREPRLLPIEFDRSSLVFDPCRNAGWIMLDGDGQDTGQVFSTAYEYMRQVLLDLGLTYPEPPWYFLPNNMSMHGGGGAVLLNLVGKGDPRKGLPLNIAWEAIAAIARALPTVQFCVMRLVDEGQMAPLLNLHGLVNLDIKSANFGDVEVTEMYCRARLIVTAEGGGYHMAYGAAKPTLLVTSKQWYALVKEYALPPIPHQVALFDEFDVGMNGITKVVEKVIEWIASNSSNV